MSNPIFLIILNRHTKQRYSSSKISLLDFALVIKLFPASYMFPLLFFFFFLSYLPSRFHLCPNKMEETVRHNINIDQITNRKYENLISVVQVCEKSHPRREEEKKTTEKEILSYFATYTGRISVEHNHFTTSFFFYFFFLLTCVCLFLKYVWIYLSIVVVWHCHQERIYS